MTISTFPKCYRDRIIGEHIEIYDLCLGKGYIAKEVADNFEKFIIQLSENLMNGNTE